MDKTALVVIDAQQEYFAPLGRIVLPDGPPAVERIAELLAWARERGMPVVHVVHESRRPGPRADGAWGAGPPGSARQSAAAPPSSPPGPRAWFTEAAW